MAARPGARPPDRRRPPAGGSPRPPPSRRPASLAWARPASASSWNAAAAGGPGRGSWKPQEPTNLGPIAGRRRMSRILCAWSPSWAIANWRRRYPSDSPASPFALLETVRAVRRLAAVDAAAAQLGLHPGQKATDAMALVPELTIAEAEPEADAAALTALIDWCVRFSPAVAPDAPDGLFLDVTGVDHLWDGEARMLADFRSRLAANSLPFRCAIADTPGAAWALAHFGEDGTIAPPGEQAPLLAPLPPAAMRLSTETWAQIERLGLRQVGQLMAIPRAPFARRFGRAALTRLDQALGRATEALTFRRPPTPWFARPAFAEPF